MALSSGVAEYLDPSVEINFQVEKCNGMDMELIVGPFEASLLPQQCELIFDNDIILVREYTMGQSRKKKMNPPTLLSVQNNE